MYWLLPPRVHLQYNHISLKRRLCDFQVLHLTSFHINCHHYFIRGGGSDVIAQRSTFPPVCPRVKPDTPWSIPVAIDVRHWAMQWWNPRSTESSTQLGTARSWAGTSCKSSWWKARWDGWMGVRRAEGRFDYIWWGHGELGEKKERESVVLPLGDVKASPIFLEICCQCWCSCSLAPACNMWQVEMQSLTVNPAEKNWKKKCFPCCSGIMPERKRQRPHQPMVLAGYLTGSFPKAASSFKRSCWLNPSGD